MIDGEQSGERGMDAVHGVSILAVGGRGGENRVVGVESEAGRGGWIRTRLANEATGVWRRDGGCVCCWLMHSVLCGAPLRSDSAPGGHD